MIKFCGSMDTVPFCDGLFNFEPVHSVITFDYGKHYERTWLLEEGAKSSAKSSAKAVPVQGTDWPAAVCER